MTRHPLFHRLVERARSDPFFLGRALAEYQQSNGVDDDALAELLDCKTEALARLALCRMPRSDAPSFQQDVRQISEYASCSPDQLAQILRRTVALLSLQRTPTADANQNMLLAARDRKGERKRDAE